MYIYKFAEEHHARHYTNSLPYGASYLPAKYTIIVFQCVVHIHSIIVVVVIAVITIQQIRTCRRGKRRTGLTTRLAFFLWLVLLTRLPSDDIAGSNTMCVVVSNKSGGWFVRLTTSWRRRTFLSYYSFVRTSTPYKNSLFLGKAFDPAQLAMSRGPAQTFADDLPHSHLATSFDIPDCQRRLQDGIL
jgi:hypothetical protein